MAKKKDEEIDKLGLLKDVTSMFSKIFKNKTLKFIGLATKTLDIVSKRLEKELKKVRRALTQLSLLAVAIVFLMVGGTMFLERLFPSLSDGLNFIAVGVGFLVCLFLYSIFTKD